MLSTDGTTATSALQGSVATTARRFQEVPEEVFSKESARNYFTAGRVAGVSFRELRLFLLSAVCGLCPLLIFITTSNEAAAVSPSHWTMLHRTKFRCDIDGHSEQSIAVGAEITSYETGMRQGLVPCAPLQNGPRWTHNCSC